MSFTHLSAHYPVVGTVDRFLAVLGVNVSATTIEERVLSHPDYPSLLTISDCLNSWQIANASLRLDKSQLDEIALPFLAHTRANFVVVVDVNPEKVTVFDENNTRSEMSREIFMQSWDGVVLLAEAEPEAGEPAYHEKSRAEKNKLIPAGLLLLSVIGLMILAMGSVSGSIGPGYGLLLPAKLAGIGITTLLLWFEIDKYNPALQKLCMGVGSKKTNCNSVLNSARSKVFSWLSWSEVGFIYFTGSFLSLLFFPEYSSQVAWLNLLTLPFVVFSLTYQGLILKQWCLLCLSVLGILLIEFGSALAGGLIRTDAINEFSEIAAPVLYFGFIFIGVASLWFLYKPVWIKNHESKHHKYELNRLKNDREIFETLLNRQNRVSGTEGLGITLGNPDSPNTILKVCNPYCNPCAEAHKELSRILDEKLDVKVQIIYNASAASWDAGREPVRHFLTVAEKDKTAHVKKLLDHWYFDPTKNYTDFAARYPEEPSVLESQDEKITAMSVWTRANHVMSTPTYFFNGKKLPAQYRLHDLKYLLKHSF